jgi:hypothetical protein
MLTIRIGELCKTDHVNPRLRLVITAMTVFTYGRWHEGRARARRLLHDLPITEAATLPDARCKLEPME